MTLQQLRYVTAIAETGTLSEAARRFYIAQPSLTASLRELEEELGLTIFRRTNRGAVLTPEGEEFLGYARQVLAQMDLMEEKYLGAAPVKHQFCVSTQHYSFAVEAFVELLREYERWGLCDTVKKVMGAWQYDDRDLERLSMIMTLHDVGFSNGEVETYMRLLLSGRDTEQERMRMLNRLRDCAMDELHFKQKQLDRLDYLRYKIQQAAKQHG